MEKLINVASYICNRYGSENGSYIDEMKLHKLLYFAQRESFIQKKAPLFNETFYGWKYGPILKEIRNAYREHAFLTVIPTEVIESIQPVMDKIFEEYADKDSWSLSRLTHGEISWKNSRKGIPEGENGDNPMDVNDIAKDADRVRARRNGLAQLKSV